MKKKAANSNDKVKISESGLLSLVASKLKDKVLFPQKVEAAKNYLSKSKLVNQ
jgi:hypothetical protein